MAVSNMNLIRALVSQLRETQALACGGGGGGGGGCGGCGGGVQTKTITSPKFQIQKQSLFLDKLYWCSYKWR